MTFCLVLEWGIKALRLNWQLKRELQIYGQVISVQKKKKCSKWATR